MNPAWLRSTTFAAPSMTGAANDFDIRLKDSVKTTDLKIMGSDRKRTI